MIERLRPAWRRIVARWLDLVLIGWLPIALLEAIDGTIGAVLAVLVLIGFEAGCHLRWGRTPGKAVLALWARRVDGAPLRPWAAVARPVVLFATFCMPWAYWIPLWATALTAWIVVAREGRGPHDLAVGSIVGAGRPPL
ncbi:MAG: RDD family protein [Acidimicrobiia bacterium]|nr:RDD family protein [Acidimicrobiia bacterium]